MKTLTIILLLGLSAGCREQQDRVVKTSDTADSVRTALEKQYAQQARAYYEDDPTLVKAVRAPEFCAQPPNGPRTTPEEADAYLRASFEQVKQTLHVSFDLEKLTVQGDTAFVLIHQQWRRMQDKGGQLRTVETEARQREWWRTTPEGWRIFFVDDVHPGVWKVDGKRIDPSKPYDPDAPPYEPDDAKPSP